MVGVTKEVSEEDVQNGFAAYFDTYFFSFDPIESIENINKSIKGDIKFSILGSEYCFDRIVNVANRDPINFRRMVIEHAFNGHVFNIASIRSLEEKIKKDFATAKANKDFFMMSDIRKKNNLISRSNG